MANAAAALPVQAEAIQGEKKQPLFVSVKGTHGAVRFSKNAEAYENLLTIGDLRRLVEAIDQMRARKAKTGMIYFEGKFAMIVGVEKRTVITAMDGANAKERIFGNIDCVTIL